MNTKDQAIKEQVIETICDEYEAEHGYRFEGKIRAQVSEVYRAYEKVTQK